MKPIGMITQQQIETERAQLGAILIDPSVLSLVIPLVTPNDFWVERHGIIYQAMLALRDCGTAIDFLTITNELERHAQLKAIGGTAYLTELIGATPTAIHAEHYAREIASAAGKRRLLSASCEIAEIAANGVGYNEAFARAQDILRYAAPRQTDDFVSSEMSAANAIIDIRLAIDEPRECAGLRTGWQAWDRKFSGARMGCLYLIEGQTSIGKTWLSLCLADQLSTIGGARVGYISLEMSEREITYRRLSRYAGIKTESLETGYIWENDCGFWRKRQFNSAEVARVEAAYHSLESQNVWVYNAHFATSSEIRAMMARMIDKHGINVFFVDYIQKCNDPGANDDTRWGNAAHQLKETADASAIAVYLMSQVNRRVSQRESRYLGADDTRGSGQVPEAADVIYGLTSPDYGKTFETTYQRKYILEVGCAKDRKGSAAGRLIEMSVNRLTGAIEEKTDAN